ncbi:hypothetical protein, partial [Kitasatospora sp. NPDC002040]|uniref:hypothetical protein n=1 Tax=Kitasatospora sp. NPDC002040 TaxID=3154661 RepID=UPI00332A1C65
LSPEAVSGTAPAAAALVLLYPAALLLHSLATSRRGFGLAVTDRQPRSASASLKVADGRITAAALAGSGW